MKKRTNKICAVTVCKYATMYVEANTPEEAYKYAKSHLNEAYEYIDEQFEDSDLGIDSYESYTTPVDEWMDYIFTEDGVMSYDDYIENLND